MRPLFSIVLLTILFVSGNSFRTRDTDSNVEIIFNRHTGFTELVMIKGYLEKKHVILDYRKIEFNKQGELIAIGFSVDFQDGFSGSASTDNLKSELRFGFNRNYSKDSKSPFGTGRL